ncbi:Mis12 protein-domain-containing protein [Xylaria flabelliformis]|nr:Mis12 protein-domain-containing protein [Xylaria flabelliformis]
MTTSSNSETELLTEHFGYPPVSLIDDVINSVNVLAERALNSIEQGLLNASPATLGFKASKSQSQQDQQQQLPPAERAKNEIESGTHQLETLLCASIDRNFDKFELYVLRNIFTVRPPELCNWIRLSHYDGLDFSSSSATTRRRGGSGNGNGNGNASSEGEGQQQQSAVVDSDVPTLESITALRRRLRESMRLNALLTAERARNEALLEDLRRLVGDPSSSSGPQVKAEENTSPGAQLAREAGEVEVEAEENRKKSPFAFLHQKGDLASSGGGAAAPLATTAAFTLSQMQALRALSTALRNVVPDLKISKADDVDDDQKGEGGPSSSRSWRRERAEYVETATRRHLETVHGLELGRHGEVRDGEWQGPGRSLARGEVEGLERVVELLGGDSDGAEGTSAPDGEEEEGELMDES